jgi:hypothetical protein
MTSRTTTGWWRMGDPAAARHAVARSRRIIELDPYSDSRWEVFVANHPLGMIYQLPSWTRLIADTYGYKPLSLGCEDESGRLVAFSRSFTSAV